MVEESKQRKDVVYDAVLYGLGATLADLAKSPVGAALAEELHKSVGSHLVEYLQKQGVTYERGPTPEETVRNIVRMFVGQLDFAELEGTEPTPDKGVHGVWRRILGLRAYAELAANYPDPFLSCPLNAVIRFELENVGHTLKVHGASTNVSEELLDSWEEVRPGRRFLVDDEQLAVSHTA